MKNKLRCLRVLLASALLLAAAGAPQWSFAQNLEAAVNEYQSGNYPFAALGFYDVYMSSNDPAALQTAEYYLGRSLLKMELLQPALYYLSGVLTAGAGHKHFLDAAEAMVELKDALRDDTFVPHYLNKAYSPDFAQIRPDVLYRINYIVGAYQYRRQQDDSAQQFLNAVAEESPAYPRAQYMLGMIAFRARNEGQALEYFKRAYERTGAITDIENLGVHYLAAMALARTHYQLGNYQQSTEFYHKVPRFTDQWIDALHEEAWGYFMRQEYGKGLGNLHTIHAPQFKQIYLPETLLLKATTYFYTCNFGKAEDSVKLFKTDYEPMMKQLEDFLAKPPTDLGLYFRILREEYQTGKTPIPEAVHYFLRTNPRFQRLAFIIAKLEEEKLIIEREPSFKGSRLANEISGISNQAREQLVQSAGKVGYSRLQDVRDTLQSLYNQAQLIQFEVLNAQKRALLRGAEATLKMITYEKMPRPVVPPDFLYFSFDGEYWMDELGYYEYTISNQCTEELD